MYKERAKPEYVGTDKWDDMIGEWSNISQQIKLDGTTYDSLLIDQIIEIETDIHIYLKKRMDNGLEILASMKSFRSISKSGREFSYIVPQSFIPLIKNIHQARDEFVEQYRLKSFGDYISKQVIKAYKRIGIYEKNRTKLHSLRHSFGCRMYLITADIKEVGKMMNHKDRTSTEQYVGYTQDLLEDFPLDAQHSAFKNNMERVKRANEEILKYLNPQMGQDKWDKIEFQEGASPHS
jgi:hypothetical protein